MTQNKNRVTIFDITPRDGEYSSGAPRPFANMSRMANDELFLSMRTEPVSALSA